MVHINNLDCQHDYLDNGQPIIETGENLLGVIVQASYIETKCKLCGTSNIRIVIFDGNYDKRSL